MNCFPYLPAYDVTPILFHTIAPFVSSSPFISITPQSIATSFSSQQNCTSYGMIIYTSGDHNFIATTTVPPVMQDIPLSISTRTDLLSKSTLLKSTNAKKSKPSTTNISNANPSQSTIDTMLAPYVHTLIVAMQKKGLELSYLACPWGPGRYSLLRVVHAFCHGLSAARLIPLIGFSSHYALFLALKTHVKNTYPNTRIRYYTSVLEKSTHASFVQIIHALENKAPRCVFRGTLMNDKLIATLQKYSSTDTHALISTNRRIMCLPQIKNSRLCIFFIPNTRDLTESTTKLVHQLKAKCTYSTEKSFDIRYEDSFIVSK